MPIILSNYDKLVECKGNKHNKIFIVLNRETREKFILKIVDLKEEETQLREIEVHKLLNHKYVIKLIDYEIRNSKILMLIELAKHGDLYGLLGQIDIMDKNKVLKLFYKILKGLQYLHSNQIIHRDIKPENILITSNFRPKLADFGTSVSKSFVANTFCGTYEYMAPEVYLRYKQTDKVDIWAVGVLLYELFNQLTPFKNDTLKTIKDKIDNKSICFNKSIDPMIIDFVYYALRFDAEDRPSINELLAHPLFKRVRSKNDRTLTTKSVPKLAFFSLKDFDQMRTRSKSKKDASSPTSCQKSPVKFEIFSGEKTKNQLQNCVRKIKICEYLLNLKNSKLPKKEKNPLLTLSNKPQTKATSIKNSLLNERSHKIASELSKKQDVYDFFSLKKKLGVNKNLPKMNEIQVSSANTTPRVAKSSSLEMKFSYIFKNGHPKTTNRNNSQGILNELYEKRQAELIRIKSLVLT